MELSMTSGVYPRAANYFKSVPFTAYLLANQLSGKRMETDFDFDRQSQLIQNALEYMCSGASGSGDTIEFDYSTPIAWTRAFGHFPARFTVNGNVCRQQTFTATPVGSKYEDGYPNVPVVDNSVPSAELQSLAETFKAALESRTGLKVFKLVLAGHIFGTGGTHF